MQYKKKIQFFHLELRGQTFLSTLCTTRSVSITATFVPLQITLPINYTQTTCINRHITVYFVRFYLLGIVLLAVILNEALIAPPATVKHDIFFFQEKKKLKTPKMVMSLKWLSSRFCFFFFHPRTGSFCNVNGNGRRSSSHLPRGISVMSSFMVHRLLTKQPTCYASETRLYVQRLREAIPITRQHARST